MQTSYALWFCPKGSCPSSASDWISTALMYVVMALDAGCCECGGPRVPLSACSRREIVLPPVIYALIRLHRKKIWRTSLGSLRSHDASTPPTRSCLPGLLRFNTRQEPGSLLPHLITPLSPPSTASNPPYQPRSMQPLATHGETGTGSRAGHSTTSGAIISRAALNDKVSQWQNSSSTFQPIHRVNDVDLSGPQLVQTIVKHQVRKSRPEKIASDIRL
jgi:hypothetical protein